MAIIGTICPRLTGHLNPLTTLCRDLQRRGHRVIFYQAPLAAEKIRSRGFEMRCFGEKEYSLEVWIITRAWSGPFPGGPTEEDRLADARTAQELAKRRDAFRQKHGMVKAAG